jgi:hypothetical protein
MWTLMMMMRSLSILAQFYAFDYLDFRTLAAPRETMRDWLRNTNCTVRQPCIRCQSVESVLPASPLCCVALFQPPLKSTMIQLKIDIREHTGLGQTQAAPKDSALPEWGSRATNYD